jgi:hypothetical protein
LCCVDAVKVCIRPCVPSVFCLRLCASFHYRTLALCRVLGTLPSALCRALSKELFVEHHTRQSHTLGNDHLYREQDSWHRHTLGKNRFVECRTLGERRRLAKGPQQSSIDDDRYLCRESEFDNRQRSYFGESLKADTLQTLLC